MTPAVINGTVSTAVAGVILAIILILVIRSMWRKKKRGGSCMGCSCGCGSCRNQSDDKDESQWN